MKKENNTVFIISLVITLLIALFAIYYNSTFKSFSDIAFAFITDNFSWMYLAIMFIFVIFVVAIACSKYGKIKLGDDDSKPEYSTLSWFAMLFCAGMGVGLVFWGISEPISHFINPINGIESGSIEAAEFAFKSVFMHWGVQPWAAYGVIGLSLAYFQFRKKKPGLISSLIEPLFGKKATKGWIGNLVDILAVFATVAGVVTSLGLGVLQISSGLETVFHISNTLMLQIVIIVLITVVFIASAVSGINRGVKILSNLTLILAGVFMIVCFIFGPKIEILNNLVTGVGNYLNDFFVDSLSISTYGDSAWVKGWRIFYWAWWIAWAPFVGVFIARISKGRTIREFIAGVVLAPTLASIVWFSIFGSLGISLGMNGILETKALQQVAAIPESGLFLILKQYPLATATSLIALFLLISFFITSADSGTFVLSMLSSKGNMNPPNIKKVLWGIIQSLLAIALLIAGGLKPLQTISIVAAFPFMFIMIAAIIALFKELKKEK